MKMEIGLDAVKLLSQGQVQILKAAFEGPAFQNKLPQIIKRLGFDHLKNRKLWKQVTKGITNQDEDRFFFSKGDWAFTQNVDDKTRDFLRRWFFFYSCLQEPEATAAHELKLTKPASFNKAVDKWGHLCRQVPTSDIEQLRRILEMHHYWDFLLLDYILLGDFPYTFSSLSIKPDAIVQWKLKKQNNKLKRYLYLKVFKATTFNAAWAILKGAVKFVRDERVQGNPTVKFSRGYLLIGPFRKKGAYTVFRKLWQTAIIKKQKRMIGVKADVRSRRVPERLEKYWSHEKKRKTYAQMVDEFNTNEKLKERFDHPVTVDIDVIRKAVKRFRTVNKS